ncbi:CSS-motif domain-containing protein [Stenotrophomonas pavanii]|uniref:CSS-motif domain-containing protein n=1 Tax=Stenotrophomonas pavanii TaxID=487698 RepID=UPI0039C6A463
MAGSTSYSQRGAITALSVLLVCLVALAIAQAILYTEDRSAADALAHTAIDRSEALSNARSLVAAAAARTGYPPCSHGDIEALKRISFESSYMSDVGRLDGNRLRCSALWGELPWTALPKPSYEMGDVRVWKSGDLPNSPYPSSNLIAQGETFAVASPSSFENIDPARSSQITVKTRQANLTFRSIGPNPYPGIDTVEAHLCSQITNACAWVIHPRRNIWSQPWPQLTAILAGAAGMGILLSYMIIHRRFGNAWTGQDFVDNSEP